MFALISFCFVIEYILLKGERIVCKDGRKNKKSRIFSDYNANSNLKYASVMGLNVIKKENKLQVALYYDEYIEIKEIWYFEKFLKERFQFEQIDTIIKYHEAVKLKEITEEWRNIIAYMAHKYPLMKPMLLLKSDVEVVENEIHTWHTNIL